jgi:hypothetical protein
MDRNDYTSYGPNSGSENIPAQNVSSPSSEKIAGSYSLSDIGKELGIISVDETVGDKREDGKLYAKGAPVLEAPGGDISDLSPDQLAIVIAGLQNDITDKQLGAASTNLENQGAQQKHQNAKSLEITQEASEKMRAAAKTGDFVRICGWIGAGAAVVLAATATVASGGAAAPLVIAAVLAVGLMIDSEMGSPVMKGLGSAFSAVFNKIPGVDDKTADQLGQYAALGVVIAAQLALVIGSGGLSAASATSSGLQMARMAGSWGQTGATAAGAGGKAVQGVQKYQADSLKVDNKAIETDLVKIQDKISKSSEEIKKLFASIQQGVGMIAGMLKEQQETKAHTTSNI